MAEVEIIPRRKAYPEEKGKLEINQQEVGRIKDIIKGLERSTNDSEIYRQVKHKGFSPHNIREAFRQSNRALVGNRGGIPIIARKVGSSAKAKRFNLLAGIKRIIMRSPRA